MGRMGTMGKIFLFSFALVILLSGEGFCSQDNSEKEFKDLMLIECPTKVQVPTFPFKFQVYSPKSIGQNEEFETQLKIINLSGSSFNDLEVEVSGHSFDDPQSQEMTEFLPCNSHGEPSHAVWRNCSLGPYQTYVISWKFRVPKEASGKGRFQFTIRDSETKLCAESGLWEFDIEKRIFKPNLLISSSISQSNKDMSDRIVWQEGSKEIFIDSSLREGNQGNLLVYIQNAGDEDATGVKVQLLIDGELASEELTGEEVSLLSERRIISEGSTIPVFFSGWPVKRGLHNFKVKIDPENQIEEHKEDDNEYGWPFYIGPDFRISKIDIVPSPGHPGEKATIKATIENFGVEPEENQLLDAALYFGNTLIKTKQIDISEEAAMRIGAPLYIWEAVFEESLPIGVQNIAVKVDPMDKFKEFREDNNERPIKLGQ